MILSKLLRRYAKKKESPIQLKYLYENSYNNKKDIIQYKNQSLFLYNELSIRLSHRIFDLMKLPYGLPLIPEIKVVIDLYNESFLRIQQHKKPKNENEIISFTELLNDIKYKHNHVDNYISDGSKKLIIH